LCGVFEVKSLGVRCQANLPPLGSVLLRFYEISVKLLDEVGDFPGIAFVNYRSSKIGPRLN
jgi:hypothetical protein